MNYATHELSVESGQIKIRPAHPHKVATHEPGPGLEAWSRLFVLEQASLMLLKHVARRLRDGGAEFHAHQINLNSCGTASDKKRRSRYNRQAV